MCLFEIYKVTAKELMVLGHFECPHSINSALIFSIHINNKKVRSLFPQRMNRKEIAKK